MIPRARPNYNLFDLARAAFRSRWEGPRCAEVIARLRDLLGVPYVLLTASGRGGLYLLLKADGRTDVIIPSYTCAAVAEAATLAGCRLVFSEHGEAKYNQEIRDLEPHLSPGRVYIATHQYGLSADIVPIVAACTASDVVLYEDIAAALGGRIDGRAVGSFGRACFGSFDTTKLINAPLKGGFIATADRTLFEQVKTVAAAELRPMRIPHKLKLLVSAAVLVCLRCQALYRVFHALNFELRGRMTAEDGVLADRPNRFYTTTFSEWQATVVAPQLKRIEVTVERRRAAYDELRELLAGLRMLTMPPARDGAAWAPIRFAVLVNGDKAAFYRRATMRGVDLGFSFTHLPAPLSHANAHDIAKRVLNVPFDNHLSKAEIKKIAAVFAAIDKSG
jgi:dTDP-4-amino-4,6-dideoxygalactose transaminase